MITKTKTALVAALILGSASTAFAVTDNAEQSTSSYLQGPSAPYARADVLERRGFALQDEDRVNGAQRSYPLTSDQMRWYDRAPIDFNS